MLYPIYVHKDENSAYGAIFPDFPGCFAGADAFQDIPAAAQEALQAHCHGETAPLPLPTAPEVWEADPRFTGGYWMLVDIDLSKISSKAMRLNISLPENLLHRIDATAKARRLTRSAFLALAVEHEMAQASRG
jgi:predicted RNase H-like HicB family nuclease